MNEQERRELEAAGWAAGDAEDFLGLTDEERRLVDLRANLGRTIRAHRERQGLTPQEFARKIKAQTAHVAALEVGVGVSLEEMFGALFALGGGLEDLRTGKPIIEHIGEPLSVVGRRSG